MKLKRDTKKKLFQLFQMLVGMGILKALDYFSNGNLFLFAVKLLLTFYVIYLMMRLLYGRASETREEEE